MHLFYSSALDRESAILTPDESYHCTKVLRLTKGQEISVTDGKGNMAYGIINQPDIRNCSIKIQKYISEYGKRDYDLCIAISPLKNRDRFEWFIEKSVELGIDTIVPLISSRSEKYNIRYDRLEKIILSAMKQSVKAYLPVMTKATEFSSFIKDATGASLFIAHCNETDRLPLTQVLRSGESVTIMIGPEGDFSPEEVSQAIALGFKGVSMGESRLRTETAGIAACHSVYFVNS